MQAGAGPGRHPSPDSDPSLWRLPGRHIGESTVCNASHMKRAMIRTRTSKPPPQLTTGRARSQRGVDRHQHLNTGNPSRLQVEPDYSINRRAPGTVPRPLLHASHRESDTSPSRPSLDCASLRPQLFSGLTGILLAANRFASDRSWVYVSWSRGVAN